MTVIVRDIKYIGNGGRGEGGKSKVLIVMVQKFEWCVYGNCSDNRNGWKLSTRIKRKKGVT